MKKKNQIITTAGGRRRVSYNLAVAASYLPVQQPTGRPLRLRGPLNPLEQSRYTYLRFRRVNETKRNLYVAVFIQLLHESRGRLIL